MGKEGELFRQGSKAHKGERGRHFSLESEVKW